MSICMNCNHDDRQGERYGQDIHFCTVSCGCKYIKKHEQLIIDARAYVSKMEPTTGFGPIKGIK